MAGIQEPDVIDLVAQDPAGDYIVIMIETRPWGTSADQSVQLKQKINSYAGYILDGTLMSQYPETVGKPIRIRLDCPEDPTGESAVVVESATRQLGERGIGFTVNRRGHDI